MIWKLDKIVAIQKQLDQKIFIKSQKNYSLTTSSRRTGIIVELCELANELRFFKFWSKKPASDKAIILDELADVLHFGLTFVIQYDASTQFEIKTSKTKLTTQELNVTFVNLIKLALKIKDKTSINMFMKKLLILASQLGFGKTDVLKAYLLKNQVNLDRSNSNY